MIEGKAEGRLGEGEPCSDIGARGHRVCLSGATGEYQIDLDRSRVHKEELVSAPAPRSRRSAVLAGVDGGHDLSAEAHRTRGDFLEDLGPGGRARSEPAPAPSGRVDGVRADVLERDRE